ncbi:MAG: hypothetical protein LBF72_03975 [Holosporales bacterium]|nr:hypothetical protein [Holosporales bacterium]
MAGEFLPNDPVSQVDGDTADFSRRGILSIYADTKVGAVSISCGEEFSLNEQIEWRDERAQSTDFLLLIDGALAKYRKLAGHNEAGASESDGLNLCGGLNLGTIIAPRGPSSFTTLRSTLTIAKSFQFCFPNAEVFAPLHFKVLALAAIEEMTTQTSCGLGYVLISALNSGFFAALFRFEACRLTPPVMVGEPRFYNKNSLQTFLNDSKNTSETLIVGPSNCDFANELAKAGRFRMIHVTKNLAVEQIKLYKATKNIDEGNQETQDDRCFSPFYLHTPNFTKLANPLLNTQRIFTPPTKTVECDQSLS